MRFPVASPLVLTLCALASVACSSSDSGKGAGEPTPGTTSQKWTKLIEGHWSLDPGTEKERDCHKVLIEEDTWITAIRPISPFGTHHTLLTLGDEKSDCTTAVVNGLLYAAGVGSEGLELPPGVAIKLPAGKYLNLGLHVYNPSEEPIEGTSGMEVKTVAAKDVEFESEAVLAGPFDIALEPGTKSTVSSTCAVTTDQNVYALFPHMHQLGTHLKTTITVDGQDDVIHDGDYSFNEQLQIPLDPILRLTKGDKVTTECTFENTLNKTVYFGESSDTEMCFSILFRYPAQGQGFCSGSGSSPQSISGPPCAKDGDAGNDKGVGQFCTKGGGECEGNDFASFCLNDLVSGEFGNFCSGSCKEDGDCGEGATCQGSGDRKACIPSACSLGASE
jgi:hypothetical protein